MSYKIKTTKQFEKSLRLCQRRGLPMEKFKEVVSLLAANGALPSQYKPHKLSGQWQGKWECHIMPDWLLVWEIHESELTLLLVQTGTHSDLFGK